MSRKKAKRQAGLRKTEELKIQMGGKQNLDGCKLTTQETCPEGYTVFLDKCNFSE